MNISLTEEQQDALQELMNISMGKAADALARLISTRINLSIPRIVSATPLDLMVLLEAREAYWFTRQSFLGASNGEVLTLLSKDGCDLLANPLGYELPLDENRRYELILELANILAGACLNGFTQQLQLKTKLNMPTLYLPDQQDITRFNWNSTLLFEVDFFVGQAHFESRVIICLEEESVALLLEHLRQFLE